MLHRGKQAITTGSIIMGRTARLSSVFTAAAIALGASAGMAQEPQSGGTLNLILQPEPPILMLGLNQQGPTQYVAGKIYEPLLIYDKDLNPQPWLAREYEISDDGLTYTFHLHDNVTWHDGEPFTAHDVVFTTSEFLREVHPRARTSFARAESIEALDDHTVQFTLSEPYAPFIFAFEVSTAPMIPAHLYEGTDYSTNPNNETPIGTGPFKFNTWDRGAVVHLVRNDDYWQEGKPYLDEIYFQIIPDAASRAVAFETGAVHVLRGGDIENFDVQRLAEMPGVELTTEGWEMVGPLSWLQMNLREAPMDDKRFRQAVMHAIDREFVRENLWFGFGTVATSPIASATLFHDPDLPKYDYDPDKAAALLDEMGLEPQAGGTRASIRMMPLPYGETWQRLAEVVREQLGAVGIDVQLESVDAGTWSSRVADWDFEMTFNFLYQYGDPALGVARNYISTNIIKGTPFANNGGYSNEEVDRLFAEAAVEIDDARRQELYSEVQQILVEDVPVAWMLELEFPTLYRDNIHNLVETGIGLNETFADVWIEE
jgi:peptide/nickel transport system substrate-binding protein